MVMSCAAYGCTNKVQKAEKKTVSFHTFPTDEDMKKKWVVAMKRKDFNPKPGTRICSAHFKPEDFEVQFGRKTIKSGIVPSIFNFPKHLIKKDPKPRSKRLELDETSTETETETTTIIPRLSTLMPEVEEISSSECPVLASSISITRKRKRSQPIYMGDFCAEDINNPKKCKLMWGIANKTIDCQRKRISYLQTKVKRLEKRVGTLLQLIDHLKDGNRISFDCSSMLKAI